MNEPTLFISTPAGTEWLFILVGIGLVFFWIKTIIEIATGKFKDDISKIAWLLIVIFTGIIGALIYAFAGRQSRIPAAQT